MPAFNAAATLPTAIRSVLDQSHADLELLVVDDGSTDGTSRMLDSWRRQDPRLRVLSHAVNRGRSAARNHAIAEAAGEWLALIDADDLWSPVRLERLLAVTRSHPTADLVTDDRIGFTVSPRGKVILRHRFPSREAWGLGGVAPLQRRGWVMDKRHFDPLVRRSFVVESGASFPENLSSAEDQTFFMELVFAARGCEAVRLAEPLYYYRLGHATRPSDQDVNFVRAVQIAVDQTGSSELRRLVAPAMAGEIAMRRRDSTLRAKAGRLVAADAIDGDDCGSADLRRRTRPWVMLRSLWFRRFLTVVSILADRRVRPSVIAEIERQLAGPDVDLPSRGSSRRLFGAFRY